MPEGLGGTIGLALGSGAARGWAHVGVIRALEEAGLRPDVVCGSSSGAVVAAMYAAGALDHFETWGRQLDWRQVVGYFDISLRGGLIRARKLLDFLTAEFSDRPIDSLPMSFAAVATDLETGHEVWLREGSVYESLLASMALPGLITPVKVDGRWLVDGGLVNPVPVSVCRALGANSVIAVDLNTALLGRRLRPPEPTVVEPAPLPAPAPLPDPDLAPSPVRAAVQEFVADLRRRVSKDESMPREPTPSIYDVVTNSINIMQVRITRSRMAGDPPDLLVAPRLGDFGPIDFDRADEAIEEGRRSVALALSAL